jgi:hypothetical protein
MLRTLHFPFRFKSKPLISVSCMLQARKGSTNLAKEKSWLTSLKSLWDTVLLNCPPLLTQGGIGHSQDNSSSSIEPGV